MKNKKASGFTLSEALIAVGVVGIISALTIPNVVKNYQKQSFLLGLQKTYTQFQETLRVMQTENYLKQGLSNSVLDRGFVEYGNNGKTIEETAGQFFRNYYKINRDCGRDTQPCFAASYKSITGSDDVDFKCSNGNSVLLSSGTAICIEPLKVQLRRPTCPIGMVCPTVIYTDYYRFAKVYVDTNGPEGPNTGGRDMFTFNIYEDYSIDVVSPDKIKNGTAKDSRNTLFEENCLTSSTGVGCFGKILNDNWKINY